MNFGEQIKKLRKDQSLTQQEMADKIGVSRQAVSNWENDKNLPDIEMLIIMSQVFRISLDELILGGTQMNNMTEKLIRDSKETTRIKMNLLGIRIGAGLLALSLVCLIAGIWVPYSLEGYCGAGFSIMAICGVITFLVVGFKNILDLRTKKHGSVKLMAVGGGLVALGILLYCLSLVTELISGYLGFGGMIIGIALLVIGGVHGKKSAAE